MMIAITAVNLLCQVIIYALLAVAILSWFVNPYTANPNSFSYKLYAFLSQVTEPIVRPFRAFMSRFNTGQFDFSILVAMLAIGLIRSVLIKILYLFV